MIVRGARQLQRFYRQMGRGDIFIGPLVSRHLKSNILIDLLERGVLCLPSALSQVLSVSKTTQTVMLTDWMVPHSTVIRRRHDLIQALSDYNRHGITTVVTKADHLHCGHGIRRWEDMEMLYNAVALEKDGYPFVLQPFVANAYSDVRVIWIGDHVEAYQREIPFNFRQNVAMGGRSRPYTPTKAQLSFCGQVMERGRFPYAHIDLMVLEDGICYLSELSLDGGSRGASISRDELVRLKSERLEEMAAELG